jgi:hypothetical protein
VVPHARQRAGLRLLLERRGRDHDQPAGCVPRSRHEEDLRRGPAGGCQLGRKDQLQHCRARSQASFSGPGTRRDPYRRAGGPVGQVGRLQMPSVTADGAAGGEPGAGSALAITSTSDAPDAAYAFLQYALGTNEGRWRCSRLRPGAVAADGRRGSPTSPSRRSSGAGRSCGRTSLPRCPASTRAAARPSSATPTHPADGADRLPQRRLRQRPGCARRRRGQIESVTGLPVAAPLSKTVAGPRAPSRGPALLLQGTSDAPPQPHGLRLPGSLPLIFAPSGSGRSSIPSG